ncbi:AmmeMemoRadiSam system radical SAM enzyme [candidate division WOR-1 bacterium RIFOXYD2_FULL_36_8]|uniref:AmmeMemoRadiSam system radical SAM enzyme n=1 Tax=candidate division WOR-1 bacterium RIFOXYB2_FULL_36_35 TaxID=1802578 RepID=A0A1F4S5N2_UNCSA|nr:MAG: AmmeMemoRadiSam system radical SAM enzyme [candidate division WOR-1 bacterium RIFOXYA2_FULL_36_21]OGC15053.1 MAG: AmmeMemoRadiSam system radical SAM enzyme [candidate division WOR-1 bacterium RIFOXYB2_FULL_36_35]OGC16435.1 MAG: AmmeMemoRadiSam system radical SAM enzyme [candidate division WOR-1 bacterium RIFOXYA12_FULL_36_13]OGC37514.1 MAG: AmmeMemoRadiSam system radical SAM enzyme [candidate division WOR-1 bacterium RIFOXYD2_FULL_36_8]
MFDQKKEALFYEKSDNEPRLWHRGENVHCFLCPRDCRIKNGSVGYCGVRQNIDGKLYSLIYNIVSSIANDPIEKKPLYHFHPGTRVLSVGTYGCNMKCGHCQNWQIAHADISNEKLSYHKIAPEDLIKLAKKYNSSGIAWTYNEPTIWFEYAFEGAKLAKVNNLYTVWVTNGYTSIPPLEMIAPYLDAYRVDIKGFTDEAYIKLANVYDFTHILKAAKKAKELGIHVECVTNVIPTINDDEKQLKDIAEWITKELGSETPWHVTRFFPYFEFSYLEPTPLETLKMAEKIGHDAGLKYVHLGNAPKNI